LTRLDLVIRLAAPADRDDLFGLIADHARFERTEATLTRAALDGILATTTPPVKILVAARQGNLLGYAAMTYDYSLWRAHRWAHLDCLFVQEEHRGLSVGRALLQAATDTARECGADRLEWQTPAWNEPAIAFYRRQNAKGLSKMRFGFAL
jgi:GNAT superfamily N-acetyltransferase